MDVDRPVKHEALVDGQIHRRFVDLLLADVLGAEHQLARWVGEDMGVGEAIDGRVQDRAAVLIAIGREVGAAAGQAQAQGRTGPDIENIVLRHLGP